MLANLVLQLVDVTEATILEKKYTVLMRANKDTEATAAGAAQSKSKPAKGMTPSKQGLRVEDQCGSHFGELLKAMNGGGIKFKCAGSNCRLKRGVLKEMKKEEVVGLVSKIPKWMSEIFLPLVKTCNGMKTKFHLAFVRLIN